LWQRAGKSGGVKSVKSLLKLEDRKYVVSGSTIITEITAAEVPAVKSKSKGGVT
jgi:hypothetical protein